jgi:CDP-alcohol phosphatidyltransferase
MKDLAGAGRNCDGMEPLQRTDFARLAGLRIGGAVAIAERRRSLGSRQVHMKWTPNKVTLLRVAVGFAAVSLFGRGAWANFAAVALTVAAIALDALDGHIARRKNLATPVGAQLDIL